jgi:hypothetical protein
MQSASTTILKPVTQSGPSSLSLRLSLLRFVKPLISFRGRLYAYFPQKVTPDSPFTSAHEGQISLVASFPTSGGFERAKLEGIILDLLSIDGVVYAYQKQLATEAGTIRLIAEYSDVNSAAHAVERLDGATIRVSPPISVMDGN